MSLRNVRILLLVLMALEVGLLIFGPQSRDHLPAVEAALAAKEKPEWWDDAALGVRYGAWVGLGLLSLLLLTSHWWTRGMSSSVPIEPIHYRPWFIGLLLAAVGLCLCLRLPLAGKSLWWDEAWSAMQASHGKWRPDSKQPDKLKFMAHDWKRCAFYYQKPTNHVPMSLAQKASQGVWRKVTGAKREDFSDLAARMPSLIASCAAVVWLAMLLLIWGRPGAGVVAAFVLALHPWHIRYGVDARGYALVVPLCIFGLIAITGLVRSRGTKVFPWVFWGLTEFFWLWAYPNALIDVAALNVAALVLVMCAQKSARDRWSALFRLGATNIFAAACFVQVFLPNLMQARHWAGQESDAHTLDGSLLCSTLSQLFLGVEFEVAQVVESAGLPSFTGLPTGNQVTCVLLILVMVITGAISLWKSSRQGTWLVLTLFVSSAVFALVTMMAGSYFYPRFIIALLPCVALLAALAFSGGPGEKGWRWTRVLTGLVIAGLGFSSLVGQQVRVLLQRPIAPLRDVAAYVQQAAGSEKRPLVACYGLGREVIPLYEPRCLQVETAGELEKIMAQAKAEQRDFFVIQGYNSFNRQLLGSGFKLLDDPALFEEVKAFAGIDPEFYFRVYRHKS